jgi:hypothetical protein
LILAPECNPESATTPSIAYAHADALARLHTVTLMVRGVNEHASAGGEELSIRSKRLAALAGPTLQLGSAKNLQI